MTLAHPSSSSSSASTPLWRGSQPSSSRARSEDISGTFSAMSSQPGGVGCRRSRQLRSARRRTTRAGTGKLRTPIRSAISSGLSGGSAAMLKAPLHVRQDRSQVGLADVLGVHRLEAQAVDPGQRRQEAAAQQEVGQEGPDEEAADLGRGLVLEDQRGTEPHDPRLGIVGFEAVELALHRDLVARVEGGRGALGRPALVDLAVLGAARVGADRGGVDQLRHAGRGGGLEDAPAALDVDPLQRHRVPRGLDRPGQVDDRIGAREDRRRGRR